MNNAAALARAAALLAALSLAPEICGAGSLPAGSNGNYLGSRLLPSQPDAACPPGIPAIYQAYEIVTGTDMRQRPWGFAQTLREVLVKATGDPRLKDDPRVATLAAQAEQYVACFAYADLMAETPLHDDQGTYDRPHRLTVTFDPAKIDALLATLGATPWRGERPVIVPVLLVRGRKPPPYLLSAEAAAGAEQRGAFATAAQQFGLKFRFPSEAELAGWGISTEHFPAAPPQAPPGEVPGEVIVAGTLEWSETLPGWIGAWCMRWHGADHRWGISGVNYDAAFRNILGGAERIASGSGEPDPMH